MFGSALYPLLACAATAVVFGGCARPLAVGQADRRAQLAALEYPADAAYGPDLDIVIDRDGSAVVMINRTASVFRDVRVWLNQQHVRELPRIEIGPGNRFDLTRWINEHREPFPVGSLLTPEEARPVLLAELFDPETGLRHRLLVWPDDTGR
ncbi:MAG: hypothetical protein AAFX76_08870 [Planctomycetota bacterium]